MTFLFFFAALVAVGFGSTVYQYRKLFGLGLTAAERKARADYFAGMKCLKNVKTYSEALSAQDAARRFRHNWDGHVDPVILNPWSDTLTKYAAARVRALAPKAYRAEVLN